MQESEFEPHEYDGDQPWHDKELFGKYYTNLDYSTTDLKDIFGCNSGTLYYWVKKHGFPKRSEIEPDKPYQNKKWLEEKYLKDNMTCEEIADCIDVSTSTILTWLKKYNIPTRGRNGSEPGAIYKDKEWLEQKYYSDRLDTNEMALLADCSPETIQFWMEKHGLDRIAMGPKVSDPFIKTDRYGYVIIHHSYRGEEYRVPLSRLLAVAEYGFDDVIDMETHHKNRIKWDNRPDNISLLTKEEHGAIHGKEGGLWRPDE